MLDLEVVLLQSLQPSCHLALRVLKTEEPREGRVVGADQEPLAMQVWLEMPHGQNHGQQLPSGHAVIALRPAKSAAEIGHSTLPILPPLGEDRTNPHVAGISVDDKGETRVGVGQDRLESGDSRGAGVVPDIGPARLGQAVERAGDRGEVLDKSAVVPRQAQKATLFAGVSGGQPVQTAAALVGLVVMPRSLTMCPKNNVFLVSREHLAGFRRSPARRIAPRTSRRFAIAPPNSLECTSKSSRYTTQRFRGTTTSALAIIRSNVAGALHNLNGMTRPDGERSLSSGRGL